MPTTRPRHVLTETDDLAEILDRAAARWPEEAGNRRRLLLRLITMGAHRAEEVEAREVARRSTVIREHAGRLTGVYRTDEVARLREDWPA